MTKPLPTGLAAGRRATLRAGRDQAQPAWRASTTIVVGIERVLHRGRWRSVEVLACPVTWHPHPEQIAIARRGYDDWCRRWTRCAMGWVRDGLVTGGKLREVEVTAAMAVSVRHKAFECRLMSGFQLLAEIRSGREVAGAD